jgi:hypothetical protein
MPIPTPPSTAKRRAVLGSADAVGAAKPTNYGDAFAEAASLINDGFDTCRANMIAQLDRFERDMVVRVGCMMIAQVAIIIAAIRFMQHP